MGVLIKVVDIKVLNSTKCDGSIQLSNRLDELGGTKFLTAGKIFLPSIPVQSINEVQPCSCQSIGGAGTR